MPVSRLSPRLPEHAILAAPHYAFRDCDAVVRARGITPHIRQKGKPTLVGRVHGEHAAGSSSGTNSWHNRFRVLLIRWEVKARNDLALVYLRPRSSHTNNHTGF